MRNPFRITVFGVVIALATTSALAIDEVMLRSGGQPVRGTIKSISKTELAVEATGRTTTVPATDVAAVRWDGEPPQLSLTRVRETNGDLDFALQSYNELLGQVPADKRYLRTDLQFLIARTLARQAVADPAKKDAAVKALNDFVAANPEFFRYYEAQQWIGRVQTAAGEYAAAQAAWARLAEAPLPELKLASRNALGRIKLAQDDLSGAMADFDAVLAEPADAPAAASERFAAQLGRAMVLQRQGNHEQALAALDEVINGASPDDASVQAEASLRKGESLRALGRDKDAVLAYLLVDIIYPGESAAHAEALYHLTQLWPAIGNAERAAEARRKLTEQYPASDWAKRL